MHNIFVYGTLMKGFNNHIALAGSKCLSNEAVLEGYAMYNLGPYPAIVREAGERVKGEVYRVSSLKIKILNTIEAEGYLYKLTPVKIKTQRGEIDGETYVYLKSTEGFKRVPFEEQPWKVSMKYK